MAAGKRIVVVGSLNADFVIKMERHPAAGETVLGSSFSQFPGGKGGNQAFAAARLGAGTGVAVSMIGQVGGDGHGVWLEQNLALGGVDVSGVGRDDHTSSGIAMISVDDTGQNQIVLVAGANGTFVPERLLEQRGRLKADIVLLQLEIPLATVEAAARAAKQAGAVVILDPAPAQALSDELLGLCDYITPNETELATLDGGTLPKGSALSRSEASSAAARLRVRVVANVIVKMGAVGALWVGEQGEHLWPAFSVTAVDTTAAGDAFNAAFAVALAEGTPPLAAGRFACAAAAISVTREGAQPGMPTRDEVVALLSP